MTSELNDADPYLRGMDILVPTQINFSWSTLVFHWGFVWHRVRNFLESRREKPCMTVSYDWKLWPQRMLLTAVCCLSERGIWKRFSKWKVGGWGSRVGELEGDYPLVHKFRWTAKCRSNWNLSQMSIALNSSLPWELNHKSHAQFSQFVSEKAFPLL